MVTCELGVERTRKIVTANDALIELRRLDGLLDDFGLKHFKLFNRAYCIVTEHIHRAIVDNQFKDSSFINAFIVTFVGYYFHALNDITSGTLSTSSPWFAMNEYAKITTAPVFLSLLIGANAHINHDLPHALAVLSKKRGIEPSLEDITKINTLLMISGKEIIHSFNETSPFYNFLKRRLQFTYYRPAMYTILYWRIVAWRDYKRQLSDDAAEARIAKRSRRIAKRLLLASRLLSSSKHQPSK